jgi:hypothetical protein
MTDQRADHPPSTAVSVYLGIAAIITLLGALAAKETARTSLHHDR